MFELYAEALERNNRALALAPRDSNVLSTRGRILAELGRMEEALTAYDTALAALSPDEARGGSVIGNQRGNLLKNLGRFAEADNAYAQAMDLLPDFADCLYNRAGNEGRWGMEAQAQGRRDEARNHFEHGIQYIERAMILNPYDPDYSTRLAELRDSRESLDRE